jgi:hypothetical protein
VQFLLEWPSNQANEIQAARVNARLQKDQQATDTAEAAEGGGGGGTGGEAAGGGGGGARQEEDKSRHHVMTACKYVTDAMLLSANDRESKRLGWAEGFTALDVR